jgi:hypothetical protein
MKKDFKFVYYKVHTKMTTAEAGAHKDIMSLSQIQAHLNNWVTIGLYLDHTITVIADSCLLYEIKKLKEKGE